MKISLISDTHFGDPASVLVASTRNGNYLLGPQYNEFKKAAGTDNDYLILLGDIFDFAVTSYDKAYKAGKFFFEQIQRDKIAKEMIYIAGNHDADIWHIVEHQINIIYQICKGRLPTEFRMSVPGVIDDRTQTNTPGFTLHGVSKQANNNYGGLFLDMITTTANGTGGVSGKPLPFNFAYPNLYFVTDKESVLITHGHYLEQYWSLLSEWAKDVFNEDLKIGDALDIKELVGINFPLNQLACTGVGQAGQLTKLLYKLQKEISAGDLKNFARYVDNLDDALDEKVFDYSWLTEVLTDSLSNFIKGKIKDAVAEIRDTRYSKEFIHKKEVLQRFKNFYEASSVEISELKGKGYNIPPPTAVIFGHTHQPIPWNAPNAPKTVIAGNTIRLFNCGGWIRNKQGVFCGAEIFKYDTQAGFSSIAIP